MSRFSIRFEIIFVIFSLILLVGFAISRCSRSHMDTDVPEVIVDTVIAEVTPPAQPTSPLPTRPASTAQRYTPLYITLDSLKLRANPTLNGEVLHRLPIDEEVVYLNETTSYTQRIYVNGQSYQEPWVRIQTHNGLTGWVYGAGVHYYRRPLQTAN